MTQHTRFLLRGVILALVLAVGSSLLAPALTYADSPDDRPGNIKIIDDVESINAYRSSLTMRFSGEAFSEDSLNQNLTVMSEVIKNPPAAHIIMTVDEEDPFFGEIEIISVDDKTYLKIDGEWIEIDEELQDNNDLVIVQNEDITAQVANFELIGMETVNGRSAYHLQGDKEHFIQMYRDLQTQEELEAIDDIQIDVWVDEAEEFIVKMLIVMESTGLNEEMPDASGRIEIMEEFYDFNSPDIIIRSPFERPAYTFNSPVRARTLWEAIK